MQKIEKFLEEIPNLIKILSINKGSFKIRLSLKLKSRIKAYNIKIDDFKYLKFPAIKEAKLNKLTASLSVKYDPSLLDENFIEQILKGKNIDINKEKIKEIISNLKDTK